MKGFEVLFLCFFIIFHIYNPGHSKPETFVIKKNQTNINDGIIDIEMMKARVSRKDIIFSHLFTVFQLGCFVVLINRNLAVYLNEAKIGFFC